jgi:hypothetical protein
LHCILEFRKCFLKSPWGERKRERENVYICEGKKERERIDFKKLANGSLGAGSLINPTTTVVMSI